MCAAGKRRSACGNDKIIQAKRGRPAEGHDAFVLPSIDAVIAPVTKRSHRQGRRRFLPLREKRDGGMVAAERGRGSETVGALHQDGRQGEKKRKRKIGSTKFRLRGRGGQSFYGPRGTRKP